MNIFLNKNVKKIIRFVFICFLLLFINTSVNGLSYGGCEYSKISRLKSIISNINVFYDYTINSNTAYFNVTLSNLTPDIYFIDTKTKKTYYYNDAIDGEITIYNYKGNGTSYKFYSALSECHGVKLGTKYVNFPNYNIYYEDELCKKYPNHGLCKKWANVSYSYNEFKKMIEEYYMEDEVEEPEIIYEKTILNIIVDFYVKYYYIILVVIILVCLGIMYLSKRKNRFNLQI